LQSGVGVYAHGGTGESGNSGGDGGDFIAGGTTSGEFGGDGVDVYGGDCSSTTAGCGYGIYAVGGENGDSVADFAGYFAGNIDVTGAITAGTKDFKIDHPLDPANKYLYHASVESSEMMNIYTGNVLLDGNGAAEVQLPSWFEAENTDFRYALTAVGMPGPNLYVSREISGGRFGIAGGRPGAKVSWQITAVRQDAFAKAHPLQVEVEKPERERGLYIHPELYGAPPEKQVAWSNHQGRRRLNPVPHPARPFRPLPPQAQQSRPVAQNAVAPATRAER
jgi:hypothetical protein